MALLSTQRLLVARVDSPDDLFEVCFGRMTLSGVTSSFLLLLIFDEHGARVVALLVQVHLAHQRPDQRQLIGGVVDDPVALEADGIGLDAQHAGADAVEGADGQAAQRLGWPGSGSPNRSASSASTRSRISLAALLVKVTAMMFHGAMPATIDHVGDAARQHPRLARAGPGQHQHRAMDRLNRFGLSGVEVVE
jgi:hypothetical protein